MSPYLTDVHIVIPLIYKHATLHGDSYFADMNKLRILRCSYYSRFSRYTQKYRYKCPCDQWTHEWPARTILAVWQESQKLEGCKGETVNQELQSSNPFQSFQKEPGLPTLWLTFAQWNSLWNSGSRMERNGFKEVGGEGNRIHEPWKWKEDYGG